MQHSNQIIQINNNTKLYLNNIATIPQSISLRTEQRRNQYERYMKEKEERIKMRQQELEMGQKKRKRSISSSTVLDFYLFFLFNSL